MSFRNSTSELNRPFTNQPIELAYGTEISLFLHCHLRGYDRHGKGIHGDHGTAVMLIMLFIHDDGL